MAASFEESVLGQVLDGKYRLQQVRLRGVWGVVFQADESFCRTFVRSVLVKVSRQTGMTDLTAPHFFGDAIRLAQALAGDAPPTSGLRPDARRSFPALLGPG